MKDNAPILRYAVYDTAIGDVTLVAGKRSLKGLFIGSFDPKECLNEENTVLYDAIVEINQFFFGQRNDFSVPLDFGTVEERARVFEIVKRIPFGETRTYGEVAKEAGLEKQVDLVVDILSKNPLPLFVPCHRVVISETEVGPYVGGETIKAHLLKMEQSSERRRFRPGHYLHPLI